MDLQVILGSFGHWQGGLWLTSLKNSPAVCPKTWQQIQHHSVTTKDQMTLSGPLFIILWIHWELVKWICRLFLGHLAIGREDCHSWLRSLKNSPAVCPMSQPQIQHSTTTTDQVTISGPLFIILWIHWELVKWICRLFLGHLAIGREDCGSEV
jgi:hypothetical protein